MNTTHHTSFACLQSNNPRRVKRTFKPRASESRPAQMIESLEERALFSATPLVGGAPLVPPNHLLPNIAIIAILIG